MKVAVIRTPGSNCDQDAYHALRDCIGIDAEYVWHKETSLSGFDGVLIPGGFTYGDYLRGGAIAAMSPVLAEVRRFAEEGRPVIGICNGFQILTEAHILPGALVRNTGRRFLCREVTLKAANRTSEWTSRCDGVLRIPIAHNEGRYVADAGTLEELQREERIAFVYCNEDGTSDEVSAPNGSTLSIAGILNKQGNVLGMMPHPERSVNSTLGPADGRLILERFLQ